MPVLDFEKPAMVKDTSVKIDNGVSSVSTTAPTLDKK